MQDVLSGNKLAHKTKAAIKNIVSQWLYHHIFCFSYAHVIIMLEGSGVLCYNTDPTTQAVEDQRVVPQVLCMH